MTNHPRRNWQFRVVKSQRGTDGKWFDYATAATFATEDAARKYAESFAVEQRAAGVAGTKINVLSRKRIEGDFGPTNHVAEYRV